MLPQVSRAAKIAAFLSLSQATLTGAFCRNSRLAGELLVQQVTMTVRLNPWEVAAILASKNA
jgi:hypothetical protein